MSAPLTDLNIRALGRRSTPSLARNFKKRRMLYYMVIPGVLYYIVFKYLPMLGVVVAFEKFNPFAGFSALWTSPFVGFHWFQVLFSQADFWKLFRNTLLISLYFIVYGFFAPLTLALLLNEVRNSHFKKATQTITYIPHFLSWAIVGGLLLEILSPNSGLMNNILGLFGIKPIYFMTEKSLFRSIVVGVGVWKEVGWDSILYLAALAGIDPSLYEAAIVDGAGRWRQTIKITLPSILPVITILLILSFGRILETGFDEIYILQNSQVYDVGDVFSTYSYRVGIGRGQFSYIAALGMFQNVVNLGMLLIVNWISRLISETSLW